MELPSRIALDSPWNRWGYLMHDYRWVVILTWVCVAIMLELVGPDWSHVARDGDLEQLPPETTLAQGEELSRQAFPSDISKSQIVLVFARQSGPLTIEDREFALQLGNKIADELKRNVVDVWNEKTPVVGESLRSKTGQAQRVVIRLKTEFMATENIFLLDDVARIVDGSREKSPEGLEIGISGSAAVGGDMLRAAAESVENTHTTTIILVAATLLVIYRSPLLVIIPLATIGLASSVSIDLLALLANWSQNHPGFPLWIRIFTTTKIFIIVLLFGAGTDFCLFLSARFREERRRQINQQPGDLREAVARAMQGVGGALVASAFTTIVGLAMMAFAKFGKFSYSGPTIAISLAVSLLACLSLVPALLATRLGGFIKPQSTEDAFWQRLWQRVADLVLGRPGFILIASLLVAAPMAWYGWNVPVTYDLLGELGPRRVSRQGTDMLRRYFPPGEIGPLVVLAESDEGNLDSGDGLVKIARLAKPLDDLEGVSQVRSLYQPMGDPPGSVSLFSGSGIMALAARESPLTKSVFVSEAGELAGKVTRLFLILTNQPFSTEAVSTLGQVETVLSRLTENPDSPWHRARFALVGPTVGIRDLAAVTSSDLRRIQVLVVLAVFFVVLILLRSPGISSYLMISVVLSYAVTLGITALVFGTLRGAEFEGLDWKVPLYLFVLLVAVGQDYNIYLVTRVIEDQRTHGLLAGLRNAIVETGGIITSCGVIMAGTFVSMTTSELHGIIELGFALTLGILLDTLVVRTVLVPAFLAVVARRHDA